MTGAKTALAQNFPIDAIQAEALQKISNAGLRPEYFEIVDGRTLEQLRNEGAILYNEDGGGSDSFVACTAAFAGDVRLIDNLVLYP